jgi:hypothetical protein
MYLAVGRGPSLICAISSVLLPYQVRTLVLYLAVSPSTKKVAGTTTYGQCEKALPRRKKIISKVRMNLVAPGFTRWGNRPSKLGRNPCVHPISNIITHSTLCTRSLLLWYKTLHTLLCTPHRTLGWKAGGGGEGGDS